MLMRVNPSGLQINRIDIDICHGDQVLVWDATNFDKKCFTGPKDIYNHINAFWAKMPAARQQKVFDIYKRIHDVFQYHFDVLPLMQKLIPLVKELCDEHDVNEISTWVAFHTNDTVVPDVFAEVYVSSDEKPGSRDQTYTKPDYRELIAMVISLRVMIPVWGEFIYRTKAGTGTNFKELYAYKLLNQANVTSSAAMEKLQAYVRKNIKVDRPIATFIHDGISSDDYPEWLVGLVLVRRLCIGDVCSKEQSTNLITSIFNYIDQRLKGNNGAKWQDTVRDKEYENGDGDQSTSRLESYKTKQDTATGETELIGHYMSDYKVVALQLKSDMNMSLLEAFYNNCLSLSHERICDPQITLAQWVLHRVIPPRGIKYFSKLNAINAIAVAQTYLWETGHKELACLISAVASDNSDSIQVSALDSRMRIPKAQMDELVRIWPYARVSLSKQKTKPANAAVIAIDSLSDKLGQGDWLLKLPDQQLAQVVGAGLNRRYGCPHDIKILLANLAIQITKPQTASI